MGMQNLMVLLKMGNLSYKGLLQAEKGACGQAIIARLLFLPKLCVAVHERHYHIMIIVP